MNVCAFRGWLSDCQLHKRDVLHEYSYLLRLIRRQIRLYVHTCWQFLAVTKPLNLSRSYIQLEISFHYAEVCVASR